MKFTEIPAGFLDFSKTDAERVYNAFAERYAHLSKAEARAMHDQAFAAFRRDIVAQEHSAKTPQMRVLMVILDCLSDRAYGTGRMQSTTGPRGSLGGDWFDERD